MGGLGGFSGYALEVLELTPIWRLRTSAAATPVEVMRLADQQWWSVSASPLAQGLQEAIGQAARLAAAPLGLSTPQMQWRVSRRRTEGATGEAGALPHAPSPEDLQTWLSGQITAQGPGPAVLLAWGAAFDGPVAAQLGETRVWLVGLPEASEGLRAPARRQVWAALVALREVLR